MKATAEEFVRAWQSSNSAKEVSEKLNLDTKYCSTKASNYRKLGVKLKKMNAKRGKRIDIDKLNQICEEL